MILMKPPGGRIACVIGGHVGHEYRRRHLAIEGGKPNAQALDASGHLQLDVACHCCGYLLRGLAPTARCPECGVPVYLSLRGDRLVYASPEWLTRVGVGFRAGQGAAVGLLALAFPGLCLAVALGHSLAWFGIPILVLWSFGVWRATTPEPGHSIGRLRVMAVVVCGCTVIVQAVALLGAWRGWQNLWVPIIVLEWACTVGLWLLQMRVAANLCRRTFSPGDIASVKVWTLIGLAGHGAVVAGMLVGAVRAAGGSRELETAAIVLSSVGALTTWVVLIGSAAVFSVMAGALERCAMVALADRQEAIQRDDPPNA